MKNFLIIKNILKLNFFFLLVSDLNSQIIDLNNEINNLEIKIIQYTSIEFLDDLKLNNFTAFKRFGKKQINKSKNFIEKLSSEQITLPNFNHERFVKNISNKNIPNNVMDILSLGEKFAMSIKKTNFPLKNFLMGI